MTHTPNLMTKIFKIISILHRINGDSPPPSQIQSPYPQSLLIVASYILEQPVEGKSELEKSLEALHESEQQFQNILDSQFLPNIQDSYSPFPVPPPQE